MDLYGVTDLTMSRAIHTMNDRKEVPKLPRSVSIASVVIAVGIVILAMRTPTLRYADELEYWNLAHSIVTGRGYSNEGLATAWRPPAWPFMLAPTQAVGVRYAVLLPVLCVIASAFLAGAATAEITRNRWGWIATPFTLLYPLNIYTATTLYPQAFATLLVMALYFVALRAYALIGKLAITTAFAAGICGALLALSVPTLAATAAFVVVYIVAQWIRYHRQMAATVTLVTFVTPILIWSTRNWIVLGSPVALSTSGGLNLLLGNNPDARADSGTAVDISHYQRAAGPLNEIARDHYMQGAALDWIRDHPGDAGKLYVKKLLNYFNPYNAPVTAVGGNGHEKIILWTCAITIVIFVAARVWYRTLVPFRAAESLFCLIFLINAPIMAVFFTRTRFRQPLDNILIIEATIGVLIASTLLTQLYSIRRRSRRGVQVSGGSIQ